MLRRLAITSLVLGAALALAAIPARTSRRPQYGGTFRVEIGAALASLDPATSAASASGDTSIWNHVDSLMRDLQNSLIDPASNNGPFHISSWQPSRLLTLQANDAFREGRPFVDAVEISMGRPLRDRLLDLELNKSDLTEIPAPDARHAADRGIRISQSQPDELLAVVFLENRATADPRARQALSLAIDRAAIVTYLLQKFGEPSAALLPQWSSGTSFLFSIAPDVPRAKELSSQIAPAPHFGLGYDSADPLEQSVAERIVVNAKESGLAVSAVGIAPQSAQKSGAAPTTDALVVRVAMDSPKPAAALDGLLRDFGAFGAGNVSANPLSDSATPQQIYDREREVLDSYRIVPLVWLPQVYGLSARVRNWIPPGPGENWPLADVWLDQNVDQNPNHGQAQGAAAAPKDRE
ncbi:MAG TPA: ABC transporter substrate-binding protein [Candidatus Acidoferrales bacterium]